MTENEETLFTVLWKQWPAGWHIRYLSPDGRYTAELLSEYPPFRALVPGCLFHWDNVRVMELGHQILSLEQARPSAVDPTSYTGFFCKKKPDPSSFLFFPSLPKDDKQTKLFLEMVAILDPYFSWLNLMIRSRSDLFEPSTK